MVLKLKLNKPDCLHRSMGMSSYSMANNMANANQCLQQQAAAYSFMHHPSAHGGHGARNPYDPIGLGYSRHSACPSAAQMHAMQSVNSQFGSVNNSANSTGLISPGVSVPVQVPGSSDLMTSASNYWSRIQWMHCSIDYRHHAPARLARLHVELHLYQVQSMFVPLRVTRL